MSDVVAQSLLRALREQLGMDVAFISEFRGGERIFRFVDTESSSCSVQVDGSDPLEASYCQRVIDGRLPELIRDSSAYSAARELPVTDALPVGAHLSVPVRLSDGRIYGTLCCYRALPDPTLADTSLELIRSLASFIAIVLESDYNDRGEMAEIRDRIMTVIDNGGPAMVYQPIVDMISGHIIGFEALARFPDGKPPNLWFDDAWRTGTGVELERAAIADQHVIADDSYLSVNLSPRSLWDDRTIDLLLSARTDRLVVEITEHAAIEDPTALTRQLHRFIDKGGRVAIDDVGIGFSGLHELVELAPHIIKLDRSLITGIERDRARRAIVAALVTYAHNVGARLVAEGVETEAEAAALFRSGVREVQGYYFARPKSIDQLEPSPIQHLPQAALERLGGPVEADPRFRRSMLDARRTTRRRS